MTTRRISVCKNIISEKHLSFNQNITTFLVRRRIFSCTTWEYHLFDNCGFKQLSLKSFKIQRKKIELLHSIFHNYILFMILVMRLRTARKILLTPADSTHIADFSQKAILSVLISPFGVFSPHTMPIIWSLRIPGST